VRHVVAELQQRHLIARHWARPKHPSGDPVLSGRTARTACSAAP